MVLSHIPFRTVLPMKYLSPKLCEMVSPFFRRFGMLKILGGCPVPLVFVTLNTDCPEFFTEKIRDMTPRPDDSKLGDQEKPVPVMSDIRGGCSLTELISNDLESLEMRLVFVRCFGKSACFGFALGAVAEKFESGKDPELFRDLKEIVKNVRWNGIRLTSKLLRNFDDLEIAESGDDVVWRTLSIGAVFPKPIGKNAQWRRQDLRIIGESLEVVKE